MRDNDEIVWGQEFFKLGVFILIIGLLLLFTGCVSSQTRAKDMVETLQENGCTITKVAVRKNSYALSTDCPRLD